MFAKPSDQPRRILIYRLGSLGDAVVALPALRLIARAFPDAERWMLTNFGLGDKAATIAQVLDGTGLVHGYIKYPIGLRNVGGLMDLRTRVRQLRFNTLVCLHPARGPVKVIRDAAFFHACGIAQLIGMPYWPWLQRPRRLADGRYEYEGARLIRSIAALGSLDLDEPEAFNLQLSQTENAAAERAMATLHPGRTIIAASIGAKDEVRNWGDDNWSRLFARLSQTYPDTQLVLLGADVEYGRTQALAAHWTGAFINLCGRLTVREAAATLARARLFIGHDSGPMHLSAAVGTPCVAIFSSRNLPGKWFPYGDIHHIIYKSIQCEGCNLTVCNQHKKACIMSITVDEVISAAAVFLDNSFRPMISNNIAN